MRRIANLSCQPGSLKTAKRETDSGPLGLPHTHGLFLRESCRTRALIVLYNSCITQKVGSEEHRRSGCSNPWGNSRVRIHFPHPPLRRDIGKKTCQPSGGARPNETVS